MRHLNYSKYWPNARHLLNDKTYLDNAYIDTMSYIYDHEYKRNWPRDDRLLPGDWEGTGYLHETRKRAEYWRFALLNACHFLTNNYLYLAQTFDPNRDWRIICNTRHSTIWDGADTIFDLQYGKINYSADQCYKTATSGKYAELPVGKYKFDWCVSEYSRSRDKAQYAEDHSSYTWHPGKCYDKRYTL
jgi:hypothetical protein